LPNTVRLPISIRQCRAADAAALAALFRASVRSVPSHDYTPSQVRAWASALTDEVKLAERMEKRLQPLLSGP
jgi:putative acetyltransferase